MKIIHVVKLIEEGRFKGGFFDKKRGLFVHGNTFSEVVETMGMTESNAASEAKYQRSIGKDCIVCSICIEDQFGDCAYEV